MGTDLEYEMRKEAFLQAARDVRGEGFAQDVIERANVYLAFLTAGSSEKALEKNRLIARHQWDFVNDCPASETMTLGEPPVAPHPLSSGPSQELIYVLQCLYASEINAGLGSFWDGGFYVWVGDDSNGKTEDHFDSPDLWRATSWLIETACARYPNSVFAATFSGMAK